MKIYTPENPGDAAMVFFPQGIAGHDENLPEVWVEVIDLDPGETAADAGWEPTGEFGIAPPGGAMFDASNQTIYVRDDHTPDDEELGVEQRTEYLYVQWEILKPVKVHA